MIRTWIFLLLFTLSAALPAQEQLAPLRHFDIFNGLPAKTLYNMCTDKNGFIWLAAENGVFRFDGQRFYQYTTRDGLCDNEIIEIFCDSRNRIWCSGYNGKISLFENGVINNEHDLIRNWQSRGFIFDIVEDAGGNIYMAGEKKQLLRIDTGMTVQELHPVNINPGSQYIGISVYKDRLYLYGSQGVFVTGILPGTSPEHGVLLYPHNKKEMQYFSRSSGNIWIVGEDNQLRGLLNNEQIDPNRLKGKILRPLEVNERYLIIEYAYSGSILYDRQTGKEYPLRLPDYVRISDAVTDIQGNIWISTRRNGLYLIRPGVYGNTEQPAADPAESVLATAVSGTELLSVTAFGDVIMQSEKGARRYSFHPRSLRPLEYASVARIKGTWYVTGDLVLEDKQLHGIRFFGRNNKESINYRDSLLFLRSSYTVLVRDLKDYRSYPLFEERLYSFCTQGDRLWMGTFRGLMYYDIPSGHLSEVQFSVPGNGRIEALQPLGNEVLLLGTSNQGLFFIKNGSVLKNVGVADGLFDLDCKEIDAFAGGWVVRHPTGLSMISIHTREVRTLSQWNNIPASSINSITISGDSILFSTTGGLFIESLREMFRQHSETRRVELLRISGPEGQLFPRNLELPYTANKLKIEFAMPEYDQPEMIVYQWRINKGAWNNSATNILDLADLSSGDYLLEIRGRAPGYKWSAVTGLAFSVGTPFWHSPVFFVLIVFVLVLSMSFIQQFLYRRQLQREREKASLQYQLINYEQRALNAMMNPHFVFNAMGSIQYFLNKGDVGEANNYLVKFSRLIRKSLEALQEEYCVLEDEIERLTLYLQMEKMRLEGRLHVHIEVDKILDAEKLSIPGMILQTYVENAVVHGIDPLKKETHIGLLFRAEGDRLLVSISDNGPGFNTDNTEKRSRRFGLSATEKRLALLSKITGKPHRVSILSPADENGGTLVRLEFPLQWMEE